MANIYKSWCPYLVWALLGAVPATSIAQQPEPEPVPEVYPVVGGVERLDPRLDSLAAPGAEVEKLAEGFEWAEGPLWDQQQDYLLFSDVPKNLVYKWQAGQGLDVFLQPSGYTGNEPYGGSQGSNGLVFDTQGRLVLCQHGDRRIARLEPDGSFTTLAEYYKWRRFNSPNDAVYKSNGDLYFTDPPYGLPQGNDDPRKELVNNAVYRLDTNGEVTRLTTRLRYPNGIAFSPDEQTLYVANSDPERAIWMAFPVESDGTLGDGRTFFDATSMTDNKEGLPDGMTVDQQGNLFATGPGGVLVLTPRAEHLGTIQTGQATSNCAWGNDGSTLYMTADMMLCRIRLQTLGIGFQAEEE